MKKGEDFSEWYNEVVDKAGLSDKRYPVKGMNVWTPYGWALMRRIDEFIRHELDSTGHSEVCFPLLIPESEFRKESMHIKGFESDVYWVTHAGLNPLDVKLLLRPTSETAMYPMFALWVRSHADLPLKTYQIVNVFRYETKVTRTFIRVREVHFFEGHTCHATFEGAEAQISEDMQIMENLSRHLAIPYLLTKRPEWDKFPGAYYSLGVDNYIAEAGRTLQIGTIHQYRDNFARAYGVRFERDVSQADIVSHVAAILEKLGFQNIITSTEDAIERSHPEIIADNAGAKWTFTIRHRIRDADGTTEAEGSLTRSVAQYQAANRVLVCPNLPAEMKERIGKLNVEVWDSVRLESEAKKAGIEPLRIHQYVHQTTYGMSERMVGAMIGVHGDDRGIVLPPDVSPIQIVIVPILEKGSQEIIGGEAAKLLGELNREFRVHLDDRDIRPGSKFYLWEAKGVPLRLELGPRDLRQNEVTFVRRDTMEKGVMPRAGLVEALRKLLGKMQGDLWERAEERLRVSIVEVKDFADFKEGLNRAGWCGSEECGHEIENRTGMGILGTPVRSEEFDGACISCGRPAINVIYVARAF